MIKLELRLEYPDGTAASAVHASVVPDNGDYVKAELRGNIIIFYMESESAGTLRNTADDLLACIKAAEESSGLVVSVSGAAADLDGDSFFE